MRAVFVRAGLPATLLAGLLLALPLPALAQQVIPPPSEPPGGGMPEIPLPDGQPPMVVPPPGDGDDGAGAGEGLPDAFGNAAPPAAALGPDNNARADETRGEKLDRLFSELRREPSADKAKVIAGRIEAEWRDSGSATVDLLMLWAGQAMAKKNNAAALDMLDQAVVMRPAYAEAWNRRATLNFATDEWGKSLADIEQTLQREPRHYGALVGLGLILERLGEKEKAMEAYSRALAVYPTLKSAQDSYSRLADETLGRTL